jgi:hypothetical protein
LQPNCAVDDTSRYNLCLDVDSDTRLDDFLEAFRRARAFWESTITGDQPRVTTNSFKIDGETIPGLTVDDIYIRGRGRPITDRPDNVLAFAGPKRFRANGIPWAGTMVFGSASIPRLINDGRFENVVRHEMGHVFGLGTVWDDLDLIRRGTYRGVNGNREWNSLGCPGRIPLAGEAHWSERCLTTELMTPVISGPSQGMPLSRMTIGSLQDIGYEVNYNCAEPFIPSATCCPNASRVITSSNVADSATDSDDIPPLTEENLAIAWEVGQEELLKMREEALSEGETDESLDSAFPDVIIVLIEQDDILYDVPVTL